jgi:hypothetical protein
VCIWNLISLSLVFHWLLLRLNYLYVNWLFRFLLLWNTFFWPLKKHFQNIRRPWRSWRGCLYVCGCVSVIKSSLGISQQYRELDWWCQDRVHSPQYEKPDVLDQAGAVPLASLIWGWGETWEDTEEGKERQPLAENPLSKALCKALSHNYLICSLSSQKVGISFILRIWDPVRLSDLSRITQSVIELFDPMCLTLSLFYSWPAKKK